MVAGIEAHGANVNLLRCRHAGNRHLVGIHTRLNGQIRSQRNEVAAWNAGIRVELHVDRAGPVMPQVKFEIFKTRQIQPHSYC
jgi:hypothetical protein